MNGRASTTGTQGTMGRGTGQRFWDILPGTRQVSSRSPMQKKVVPMFHVPDVRRTVGWYEDLGFDVTATYGDAGDGLSFAIVSFGAGQVMFSSGGWLSPRRRREVDLYAYVDDVDALYERVKDRIEIVQGPHNTFYGMREVIVRDVNGFWITFGQEVSPEVLTPWPAVDPEVLLPYPGKYQSESGLAVLITIQNGRLLAFPEDGSGAFLMPSGEQTFTPMITEEARVVFEGGPGARPALTLEQAGRTTRFVRVS
jgi:uncharacterized glyoxalase superfamily protein PhnB